MSPAGDRPVVMVPGDIEVEDRLAGPVTFRMAGWLAVALVGGFAAVLRWPQPAWVAMGGLVAAGALAGAFCRPQGLPLLTWARLGYGYLRRRRVHSGPNQAPSDPTTEPATDPAADPVTQPNTQPNTWPTTAPAAEPPGEGRARRTRKDSAEPPSRPAGRPDAEPPSRSAGRPGAEPAPRRTRKGAAAPPSRSVGRPDAEPAPRRRSARALGWAECAGLLALGVALGVGSWLLSSPGRPGSVTPTRVAPAPAANAPAAHAPVPPAPVPQAPAAPAPQAPLGQPVQPTLPVAPVSPDPWLSIPLLPEPFGTDPGLGCGC